MKYFGGKNRLGKDLANIINNFIDEETTYIEPFVGGGGILPYLKTPKKIVLNDKHPYLMETWKQLNEGWFPSEEWDPKTPENYCSEGKAIYDELRPKFKYPAEKNLNDTKFSDGFIGYFGFNSCYSGRWFEGFAKAKNNKGIYRIYYNESFKTTRLKQEFLQKTECEFYSLDYSEAILKGIKYEGKYPEGFARCLSNDKQNKVIYLDPPYLNTKWYTGVTKEKDTLDYKMFWDFVKRLSYFHWVFVSEQQAPEDEFIDIRNNKKHFTRGMKDSDGRNIKAPERLFIHKSRLDDYKKVMGENEN